jgi:DNA (cytosine-5)-methyltransferase 1
MRVASLFSGIGGIELGLSSHGFEIALLCEIDPVARAILHRHFLQTEIVDDVFKIHSLPKAELVTAGFPCQDLSLAGAKKGIAGGKSGVVSKLFDLLEQAPRSQRPDWLLIENVPYMLRLSRGHAMDFVTTELSRLGYSWAYRVVDARCFGLPQRRPRVVLLASRTGNPEEVLFADNHDVPDLDGKPGDVEGVDAFGFYWTEGSRGVGWAREGVPPIKCGSTVGIASPPAVWVPSRDFVGMIDIRDAERLQGFPEDWTDFGALGIKSRSSFRWRLVGNAVSTRLSDWVGSRLKSPKPSICSRRPRDRNKAWPDAAFGHGRDIFEVQATRWASSAPQVRLSEFIRYDLKPLSHRATQGFLKRAEGCTNVVYSEIFLKSLQRHSLTQKT